MSSIGSPSPFFLAGKKAYEIERSLRFNRSDSAYITRSVSSTGNRRVWTVSFWMKFCEVTGSNSQRLWSNDSGNGSGDILKIEFDSGADSNRRLSVIDNNHAGSGIRFVGDRRFRDPSAWYHIVLAVDTTQSTAADRVKIYVNNELTTVFKSGSEHNHPPNQNYDTCVNLSGKSNAWGRSFSFGNSSADHFDGYLAEINFIDGFQYDPSYFGETDVTTGQWNPKKYVGSYGTNGYYLNFSDNSGTTATTLGKDSSGNGNNFTPNNFSVAAGTGNDSLEDTPTNNFATLNALKKPTNGALSNGNLDGSGNASTWVSFFSTILVSSGKWFCEVKVNATRVGVGIAKDGANENSYLGSAADTYAYFDLNGKWNNNSNSSYGATYTTNDIIGMALDMDAGTLIFYKNGASQGTAFTGLSGEFALGFSVYGGSANASINYGQRAFDYTPPTGYKALNSANLPDPTILLPNKNFGTLLWTGNATVRTISDTSEVNFTPDWVWVKSRSHGDDHQLTDSVRGSSKALKSNATEAEIDWDVAYSGNNKGMGDYVNGGFILDDNGNNQRYNRNSATFVAWNWNAGDTDGKTYTVKVVSDSGNKYRFDDFGTSAVTLDLAEGGTYIFDQSHSSNAGHPLRFSTTSNGTHGGGTEYTTGVTTAGTPGQSGAYTQIVVAASAPTLYYYCTQHSGMGGQANTNSTLGSSNFDGTIQSTVKASTTAGFSIVSFTGNATSGATVGHGLGVAPKVLIVKERGNTNNWVFYHQSLGSTGGGDTYVLFLDLNNDKGGGFAGGFNNTSPTSSVFSLGNSNETNRSSGNFITYCFSEVAGYSKFGSYQANGSSDGPFVFTGFRPAWILIKNADLGQPWVLMDNKINPHNLADTRLSPSSSATQYTGGDNYIDILSNGFKVRSGSSTDINYSTSYPNHIYLAFAESPFKNARAR